MRRTVLTSIVLALAAAAPAAAQQPVLDIPLKAKLTACHTGLDPASRYAVFVGQMPALKDTRRMRMRFDLYERSSDARWHRVGVPKFGTWEKSRPGKAGFIYTKRVGELLAPASYRVVVRYRWYDASGALQRRAKRRSPACRQPDPRPDLEVGGVDATSVQGGRYRYAITVRNDGRGDAGPFGLVLEVDGRPQPAERIAGLPARGGVTVFVTAPACAPGSRVQLTVDPDGAIDEADEADNAVARPCPAA